MNNNELLLSLFKIRKALCGSSIETERAKDANDALFSIEWNLNGAYFYTVRKSDWSEKYFTSLEESWKYYCKNEDSIELTRTDNYGCVKVIEYKK